MDSQRPKAELGWTSDGPAETTGFDTGFQTDWLMIRTVAALQSALHQGEVFHSDWLVVQTATKLIPEAEQAQEKLCHTYWFPLYAYVRRRGRPGAIRHNHPPVAGRQPPPVGRGVGLGEGCGE